MTPTRQRRLIMVGLVLLAVGVATALVVTAMSQNLTYLYTPVEVKSGKVPAQARFRLGGMVKAGSIERDPNSLKVNFLVTDGDADMLVEYNNILPDLFREKQSVIATGQMQGDRFLATEVLAKHDEKYVPRDVQEAMAKAHSKHDVPAPDAAKPASN
ncbi:cytochrome c maturation protein CcmE [Tahibacter amnicola]|uniref:Cytochrome c-type biogenesis protein CcmE n=1 Tax=Tahibacter amnicola TaxID=2976241 RepID=A0ABY6BAF0_9GAMM|nr:cytochrome c maturation protein CcmE [Tahibacter amnicola]UXI67038.1 cytochrome c maturation protein CcmE [Tahibacter amnicola]